MDINCTTEEIPNVIDGKEIEVLITASIETLKRQKSKCGKDKVFKLVKDTIENITRKIFGETIESLIESDSVKCSLISNRTCLSLRKSFAEVKSFKDKLKLIHLKMLLTPPLMVLKYLRLTY